MPRVKRGTMHVKRRRNILEKAKGMYLGRRTRIKIAKEATTRAGAHAYRGRRLKKRDFRALWNIKINAAARENGTTYGKLMAGLKKKNIVLNRKMLAELAEKQKPVFKAIAEAVR